MSMTNKPFLICIDSDGCAIDSMTVKHARCFGPCLVKQWNLQEHEGKILQAWNQTNLYTATRGINRFHGLAVALRQIHQNDRPIDGIEALEAWVNHSRELSEQALQSEIHQNHSPCLQQALAWSQQVNQAIRELPPNAIQAFPGVREALREAAQVADIAIVSSANRAAITEEWSRFGLMSYVKYTMAQDSGKKSECIASLLDRGYAAHRTLMCGDALGDERAAKANSVWFFPIVAGQESKSWTEFMNHALGRLVSGRYADYEAEQVKIFHDNLGIRGE